MDVHALIIVLLFIGVFLGVTSLLKVYTDKIGFPYTVALLILGFFTQLLVNYFAIHFDVSLSTDVIYYVLLPLLLFESAIKVNAHQFRLQFKTITFLSTFGLLAGIFVVAAGLSLAIGLPFSIALLFGAVISATDPIAVLAVFRSLGCPKRLALVAEGESMFNDATAVIAFRIISGIVLSQVAGHSLSLSASLIQFLYVFIGSMLFGGLLGLMTAKIIEKIDSDRLGETTLTVALAFLSFIAAEHFFHLSGVISTVIAGIVLGNIGRTKISGSVVHFIHEFWEYLGFVGVSAIFFFAAYQLDISFFFSHSVTTLIVIAIVLLSRAVSIYGAFFITNHSKFFVDEPNVPLSWQHVLNWGGLRGVIPLVLVYSLPEEFMYKEEFIKYTFASFLFTLFVNATTIAWLLRKLQLHLPKKAEEIIHAEEDIFKLEHSQRNLDSLSNIDFNPTVIHRVKEKLQLEEKNIQEKFLTLLTPRELEKSLDLEILHIEKEYIQELYLEGHINEAVFYEFDAELDLQEDALEYPEITSRGIRKSGYIDSQERFSAQLQEISVKFKILPILSFLFPDKKNQTILNRFLLLQARILASRKVIEYLEEVKKLLPPHHRNHRVITDIVSRHEQHRLRNSFQMQALEREYPRLYQQFEEHLVETYAWEEKKIANSFILAN